MISQPFILFLVEFEYFPVVSLLNTAYSIPGVTIFQVCTMYTEEIFMMADILGVDRVKIAFAERKVVDGIQQVCFARAIITNKAIDFI
jgi:hypothetical protein